MGNYDPNDQEVMEANDIRFENESFYFGKSPPFRSFKQLENALAYAKKQGLPGGLTSEQRLTSKQKENNDQTGEQEEAIKTIPLPIDTSGSGLMGVFLLFLVWVGGALFSISAISNLKEAGLPDEPYNRLVAGAILMFFHSLLLLFVIHQNNADVRAIHNYLRAKNSQ